MDELGNAQAASSFITDQSQSDVVPALDQALQIVEQHLSQLRTQNGHR
ncbi:hypothetical protein Q2T42_00010 [Leptolyngbya boryana CZ1]|uniref:Uncharacterized protein n=1 Tax=Leptolyngbya boryana CZ1 TaxID=3060204 RepID=A0AA97AQ15_LEPBY|nr:hypothetical protein [Leptolyngbya boryana]WNZ46222.1 hypothetical protein Q2T42_00010 [Leptolyngbya boryana CZ1]